MPFVKDVVVTFAVVRGGAVVTSQEGTIAFDHTETGNGTLGGVTVTDVRWTGLDVRALFAIPNPPDGVGTIRPRRPDEILAPDLALYTSMWTTGGTVVVTFNSALGADTITIQLRTIPTIDVLVFRGATATVDPILASAPLPVPFNSYVWTVTGALGLSVSAPGSGVSAQLAVSDASGAWGTTAPQNFTLTIRSRKGGAVDDTVDSVATFAGGTALQQPHLTLRQPLAVDDDGTPLSGYTFFAGQTSSGRGLNAAIVPPASGILARRGVVLGTIVTDLDNELRLTPSGGQIAALPTFVPFGAAPSVMTIELSHSDGAIPIVRYPATLALRRLDDAAAPVDANIPIPNPGGGITLRVEDGETHDWLGVGASGFATASINPPFVPPVNNAATIGLGFVGLVGGDPGTLTVTLRRSVPGRARSIGASIGATVAMPSITPIGVTPPVLPGGRAKMLYQTTLTASTAAGAGEELAWDVISPAGFAFATPTTTAAANVLRASAHLLAVWGGTTQNVVVRVTKRPSGGGATIEGGNDVTLQLPVAVSKDPVNVALVLDRSGSMTITSGITNRWFKAVSGAHFFAGQVAAENATRVVGNRHNVAVLWFGGWDTVADNYSAPSTDPFGEGNFGVLTVGGNVLDFADPLAPYLASLDAAKDSLEPLTTPKFWTAVGAGLLFGREKLRAADLPAARERVLVCLSDGEENRPPLVADATTAPRWQQLQDGTNIGDPLVRVFGAAVATTTAAANTLRTAVTNTGGDPVLDVKEVPDAGSIIQQWFSNTFSSLFGFSTIVAGYDPTLSTGETAAHVVRVTQAHTRLVVTAFFDEKPATNEDWDITIAPPGGGEITEADAGPLPGIAFRRGPLYRSFIIDLPLTISGHEHRWAGDWVFRVRRHGAGSATYIVNAIAKADVESELRILGSSSPAPGDTVRVRVDASYDGGKPLLGATVRALVTPPGVWRDGAVAAAASGTPVNANGDGGIAWQNATQALAKAGVFVDGTPITLSLAEVGGGGYEAILPLTVPGGWSIDATIEGVRPPKKRLPFDVIMDGIRRHYGFPEALRFELGIASMNVRPLQSFVIEERQTLGVRFVPSAEHSPSGGLALGENISLWVRPHDTSLRLLGPGHAADLYFEHEDLPGRRWRGRDGGDGTYTARVMLVSKVPPIIDRHLGKLIAQGLAFQDPITSKPIPRFHQQMRLDGWVARALGVTIPIKMGWKLQAMDGARTKLLPPTYVVAVANAIRAAEAVKPARKLDDAEAKALRQLDAVFARTIDVPFFESRTAAAWIPHALSAAAIAIEAALLDVHDTPVGPALVALSVAYESARDRLRRFADDDGAKKYGAKEPRASERAIFETWEDVRAATDGFRHALRPNERGSERPTSA